MIGMFAAVERYVKVDHAASLIKISGVERGYVPKRSRSRFRGCVN